MELVKTEELAKGLGNNGRKPLATQVLMRSESASHRAEPAWLLSSITIGKRGHSLH